MKPPAKTKHSPATSLKEQLKPLAKTLAQSPRKVNMAAALPPPEDDAMLFRRVVGKVNLLKHPVPHVHQRSQPSPLPMQRRRDDARVMNDAMSDFWPWDEIESGEELLYLRAGMRTDTLQKLRKGHWVVSRQLDLHGLNTDDARAAVGEFVHRCVNEDQRCVRIIHGKGLGSKNREPVLKNKLRNWLAQREEVLAFCQARPVDGGSGAVIVLLRGRRR
ncbi:MAG: Smr/MutS family protein [Burkholderiales bacterium]|nr:Smr/MutS family protein [Burkholderiales bacterium]